MPHLIYSSKKKIALPVGEAWKNRKRALPDCFFIKQNSLFPYTRRRHAALTFGTDHRLYFHGCPFHHSELSISIRGGGVEGKMVKKASIVAAPLNMLWLGFKLVVGLSVLLYVFAIWELNSDFNPSNHGSNHRRSRSFVGTHFDGRPKISFLFLAPLDLPLDFLWGSFFKNAI